MGAVKHHPFDMIPQVRKRSEDFAEGVARIVVEQSENVFKQKQRRSFGFNQSGNFKEESASGILESLSFASLRKCLAGESCTEEVEVGEVVGVDFSCVVKVAFILLYIVDCGIACVGILVDFAVAHALESTHTGEASTEATDASEHIKISYQ